MIIIWLFSITLLHSLLTTNAQYSIETINKSAGLFYQDLGNTKMYHTYQSLIQFTDLHTYETKLFTITTSLKEMQNVCQQNVTYATCGKAENLMQQEIPQLSEKLKVVQNLVSRKHTIRHKRGLIDVGSSILNYLIGMYT